MNIYKKLRKEAGLTQGEVAVSLGVKQQTVQKWEYGENRPPPSRWAAIAELYRVPVEVLLQAGTAEAGQVTATSQTMIGSNGAQQAGGDISTGTAPPAGSSGGLIMVFLTPQEARMIELLRDYGGRKAVDKFISDLERRKEELES